MERFQRPLIPALGFDEIESSVNYVLGDSFLALVHDVIHELGEDEIPKFRVWENIALLGAAAAGHSLNFLFLLDPRLRGDDIHFAHRHFGRLAP